MAIYLGDLELATGAAAATGTGFPVNSYAPFFISGTGNPLGYNANGLYSHPNGDVWMETGKTLIDSAGAYPDATGVPGVTATWASVGSFNSGGTSISGGVYGIWSDGSDVFICTENAGTGRMKRFNSSLVFQNEVSGGAAFNGYMTGDVALGKIWVNNFGNITEYSYPSMVATGTTYTLSTGGSAGFYYHAATQKFYTNESSPQVIRRWSNTFVLEQTLTISNPTGVQYGMSGFPGSPYLFCSNNSSIRAVKIDMTDAAQSGVLNNITGGSLESGLWVDANTAFSPNRFNDIKKSSNWAAGTLVGNATTQYGGSSASNIPMFVKLK